MNIHKPSPAALRGFVSGVLIFAGCRSVPALAAYLLVGEVGIPAIVDATLASLALPLGIALLCQVSRSLLFAQLYLGAALVGALFRICFALGLQLPSQLPSWSSAITGALFLISFLLAFRIRNLAVDPTA